MFCPNCGKEYTELDREFCENCGYSLINNSIIKNPKKHTIYKYCILFFLLLILNIFFLINKDYVKNYNDKINNFISQYIKEEKRENINKTEDVDFTPYMQKLQNDIKRNWNPPKTNESRHTVVLFKVSKTGELLKLDLKKSSGCEECDKAAAEAVIYTSPFEPLPVEFKGDNVDIHFTFDYNVIGK